MSASRPEPKRRKVGVDDDADKLPTGRRWIQDEDPTYDKTKPPPLSLRVEEPMKRYAIRWDATSFKEDAQKISIDSSTTLLELTRTLFDLFGFRKPQHRLEDVKIWMTSFSVDFDKTLRSLGYDGTDKRWLRQLQGLVRSVQKTVGVDDENCVFIVRYVEKENTINQQPMVMGTSMQPLLGFAGDKYWNLGSK